MVAQVGAGSASASAEQLTAKPQEETAVELELVRIAAEFAPNICPPQTHVVEREVSL
jgi:hypothetical protein